MEPKVTRVPEAPRDDEELNIEVTRPRDPAQGHEDWRDGGDDDGSVNEAELLGYDPEDDRKDDMPQSMPKLD